MDAAGDADPGRDGAEDSGHVRIQGSFGVMVGDNGSQHNCFHGPGRVAGTAYLEQVRDIGPAELRDRERELQELADFCLGDELCVWWQAGPWAGKSALMSWFVLHPPPGVDVVCFFITGRLAAQADSTAFTEAVLEQVAFLTGEHLPASLALTARDAHRRQLLREAAQHADQNGRRLVLVIDGLDEDRSRGPDAASGAGLPSIASLLPRHPVEGLRVIVSGRPDPEIPHDVPDDHPLRHCAVRRLAPSAYASDIERVAKEELRRLLNGSHAGRSVLGLVAAAQGGLARSDLQELTGLAPYEVSELLSGVAGRTFARRSSRWAPGSGSEVYLLGHEELQAAAVAFLGPGQLAASRDRLDAWADAWRARGWPADTPEYLLSGYYRLLVTRGDLPGVIACGLDQVRHDRMLDVTGADAAALTEARTALDLIAVLEAPDLSSALALACHRDRLADRNANIPGALPAVWAALGDAARAQALAVSINDPRERANTLAQVAVALAESGEHEKVVTAAEQAKDAAGSITNYHWFERGAADLWWTRLEADSHEWDIATGQAKPRTYAPAHPHQQAAVLMQTAKALAKAGHHEQAEAMARSITDPGELAHALAQVAVAMAETGHKGRAAAAAEQAHAAAGSIANSPLRAAVSIQVVKALAMAGLAQRAVAVAEQSHQAALSLTDPREQAVVLARASEALAEAGRHQRAEAVARSITDPDHQARALARVTAALAKAGSRDQVAVVAGCARSAALSIASPNQQVAALADIASVLGEVGQHELAAAIALQAEAAARSITHPFALANALLDVAKMLAKMGECKRAEAVARLITDLPKRAVALAQIAAVLAESGQHQQAVASALQAEAVARSVADPLALAIALTQIAVTLAETGQHEQAEASASQAEAVVRPFTGDPEWQAVVLARVSVALAKAGRHEHAIATAEHADVLAKSITDERSLTFILTTIAGALARAGQHERAIATAESMADPYQQARALGRVAEMLAAAGHRERASGAAIQMESVTGSITNPHSRAVALALAAKALLMAGQRDAAVAAAVRAEKVANSITDTSLQADALMAVAGALGKAGQRERAAEIAERAETVARLITDLFKRADALGRVAGVLAMAGRHEQAVELANSITDTEAHADALTRVAGALAKAGQREGAAEIAVRAETVAQSIINPFQQARTLALLTETLIWNADIQSAHRVAVATCIVGPWTIAARPVLLLTHGRQ